MGASGCGPPTESQSEPDVASGADTEADEAVVATCATEAEESSTADYRLLIERLAPQSVGEARKDRSSDGGLSWSA